MTVSRRGLLAGSAAGKTMIPVDLSRVRAPTQIISARDDGYGTNASARYIAWRIEGAWFLSFESGGNTWIGHNNEVMAAIAALLKSLQPAAP